MPGSCKIQGSPAGRFSFDAHAIVLIIHGLRNGIYLLLKFANDHIM